MAGQNPTRLNWAAIWRLAITCAWLLALGTWVSEAVYQATAPQPHWTQAGMLLLLGVSLPLVYWLEGVEIAVADLKDKEADQIGNAQARRVLKQITEKLNVFVSQQQALALIVVSLVSMLAAPAFTTMHLYVPGVMARGDAWVLGKGEAISSSGATPGPGTAGAQPGWGGEFAAQIDALLVISVTLLCVCQIPAKRFALHNSENFLAGARHIWPLIRLTGRLNIAAPADFVTDARVMGWLGIQARRLPPGRAAHYNASAQIYGYATDQASIRINLRTDGSADITRRMLVLFLQGERNQITSGQMRAGTQGLRFLDYIKLEACWSMPAVEDLAQYAPAFDQIFTGLSDGRSLGDLLAEDSAAASPTLRDVTEQPGIAKRSVCTVAHSPAEKPDWAMTFLDHLPERALPNNAEATHIIGIVYQVRGVAQPGSFPIRMGRDYWQEQIAGPVRRLDFSVASEAPAVFDVALCDCKAGLPAGPYGSGVQADLRLEAERCRRSLLDSGAINFPVQSAMYTLEWEMMLFPGGGTTPGETDQPVSRADAAHAA